MQISQIIKTADNNFSIDDIYLDYEFDTLALAGTDIELTYCTFLDDIKYSENFNKNTRMIITTQEIASQIDKKSIAISSNPRISFFEMHNYLATTKEYAMIDDFDTVIGENTIISNLASIATHNVKIGENVKIEEFVSIKENTIIGDNVFIGAGTIVGGEGYEFKRLNSGSVLSVKHKGWTIIEDNVTVQYNTCIDKAIYPWDRTILGEYSKIDNLVHIAHGVKLGKAVFVVAGALIGGRTIIEDGTWVGVGTTVSNGLKIGQAARVNLGAVVTRNVQENGSVSGNFAIDHKKFIEFIKSIS